MLIDDQCSIYEHRPRTCRTYDCRIFPAAGLEVEDDKALIARRAQRWRFGFPSPDDRAEHDAVRAAAAFLDRHPGLLRDTAAPPSKTQLAGLAVAIHRTFLGRHEETGRATVVDPDPEVVRVALTRRRGAGEGAGAGEPVQPVGPPSS
jgi:hypothetical protein